MSPDTDKGAKSLDKILVLSRLEAVRHRGDAPYVLISIRSPGESIPKLRVDTFRIARINLIIYDTLPEWEAANREPVPAMTVQDAKRISRFVNSYWERCNIVVHCRLGASRSAGVAAGILDALSLDATLYERAPYQPNCHIRHLTREALAPYVTSGSFKLPKCNRRLPH